MQAARLARVALEHQLVVLEARDELDHVDAALECEVRDRGLGRVIPLEEEGELRPEVVEQVLRRDRRLECFRQQLHELRASLRCRDVDCSLVQRTRERRQDVPPDRRAAERERPQIDVGREQLGRFLGSFRPSAVVEVLVEHDEVVDPEGFEVFPRDPAAGLHQGHRPPSRELERRPQKAFELQLVDELREADEQDGRRVGSNLDPAERCAMSGPESP
jgi:hypothetical protein